MLISSLLLANLQIFIHFWQENLLVSHAKYEYKRQLKIPLPQIPTLLFDCTHRHPRHRKPYLKSFVKFFGFLFVHFPCKLNFPTNHPRLEHFCYQELFWGRFFVFSDQNDHSRIKSRHFLVKINALHNVPR